MRPEGFEPPTSWSVARHSIQLSYGRIQQLAFFATSEECPRQDSNLYAVSDTGPSNQPVYQFQHVGDTKTVQTAKTDQTMLEEGLEPSRG